MVLGDSEYSRQIKSYFICDVRFHFTKTLHFHPYVKTASDNKGVGKC